MTRRLVALLIVVLALAAAAPAGASSEGVVYKVTFETPDGRFRTVIADPASVERLDAAMAARDVSLVGIPNGVVVRGDGGVNRGHEWHLEDVELADFTIELCDGTATYVDEHLDEWIRDVGRYCPWSARLVAFVRYGARSDEPNAQATMSGSSSRQNGPPWSPTRSVMTTSARASRSASAHRVAFSAKNGSNVPATRYVRGNELAMSPGGR